MSRSYRQIVSENVFTFINSYIFGLGIALVALGRLGDELLASLSKSEHTTETEGGTA